MYALYSSPDIVLNFNYVKGWFFVDLVAALPFDFLYASDVYSGEVGIFHPLINNFMSSFVFLEKAAIFT